jgi:hypothetical protein
MTRREKTRELFIELINEQLKPHNVTYDEVKEDPQWYLRYSTTVEDEKEFIDHCVNRIREVLKLSKPLALKEAQWFILQWGLTTVENHPLLEDTKENSRIKKNQ